MKKIMQFAVFLMALSLSNTLKANDNMNTLTSKEQNIALAAAHAAVGDQTGLKTALTQGLDSGVTVNEFKEVLVQVYAYCGFPRSLNSLTTYMGLLKERGGKDAQGRLPGPLPDGKSLDFGASNQAKLSGGPVTGELFEFAPAIDAFLKGHLFGDIFGRDNLDWKTREIATIAMLSAMDGVESQLNGHIAIGKHNGLTDEQVQAIQKLVAYNVKGGTRTSPFPLGPENTAYAQYFSGKVWMSTLTHDERLGVPMNNVTFEPGCRNNWHSHTGGQLLIAVGGVGYYQERGKPARRLVAGDVVEIAPNIEHWHGAAPDSWFSHLAVTTNPKTNKNTWFEPVSDADYAEATKEPSR